MSSSKPYLIRAIIEWIVDNSLTPHMLVDTTCSGTVVPIGFVENNRIVLNISSTAAQKLYLGNEHITFAARFSGRSHEIYLPLDSIIAVYAKENGKGMVFQNDEPVEDQSTVDQTRTKSPVLKVIK